MTLLGRYKNGNYWVAIFDDGTKVRSVEDDDFCPAFAENCDVKLTDCCDGGCSWCYEGCTPNGKHGDILNYKFLDTLHPYTELTVNGNDLTHPDMVPFMHKMREKRVILNMTVNQLHFERHFELLKEWSQAGLIHGLGVSLREPSDEFIAKVAQTPNAVVHVINGVVSVADLARMADHDLKILILGYKYLRRGKSYYADNFENVMVLQEDLSRALFPEIIEHGWFKVVSFDNLAIDQLHIKDQMPAEKWDEFYMGDDGKFTFYLDLVAGTFGRNSLATQRYPIMDNIDDMFQKILGERNLT